MSQPDPLGSDSAMHSARGHSGRSPTQSPSGLHQSYLSCVAVVTVGALGDEVFAAILALAAMLSCGGLCRRSRLHRLGHRSRHRGQRLSVSGVSASHALSPSVEQKRSPERLPASLLTSQVVAS